MNTLKRYMIAGAAILGGLNVVVQGWSLFTALIPYDASHAVVSLVSQTLFAVALGALVGGVLALVGRSAGRTAMAVGAVAGVVVALVPDLVTWLTDGRLTMLDVLASSATAMVTYACLGASAVGLLWHVRNDVSAQSAQRPAAIGAAAGAAVSLAYIALLFYRFPDFDYSEVMGSLVTTLVTHLVVATAVGALVGATLALVGASRGRTWMVLGAGLGMLTALAPALFYLESYSEAVQGGPSAYASFVLDVAGASMAIAAGVLAAAAGLFWCATDRATGEVAEAEVSV